MDTEVIGATGIDISDGVVYENQPLVYNEAVSDTPIVEVEVDPKYSRFKSAPWFRKEDVIVGGTGGIGSHLTFLLTRAGFNCSVYDMDTLESHNISGQLFATNQVGQKKTDALNAIVKLLCDESIDTFGEYDDEGMTHKYMFSAFDNIPARQLMFNKWLNNNYGSEDACFIDGRLLFEQLIIHCIDIRDEAAIEKYQREELFNTDDMEKIDCTLKQTTHTASMIASHMVGFFTNYLRTLHSPIPLINFPFKWEYNVSVGLISQ